MQNNTKLQREMLVKDYHRPCFHYVPPSNWMNDPNGVIQWNDQYHLFYQYNPAGAFHSSMHWGHAVSRDLIHWEDLPVALYPTPNSVDEGGIFSGCAINYQGQPVIFYTGVSGDNFERQVQCMATGSSDLITWEKYSENPVIDAIPSEANQTRDFRDPFVWQQDDYWYMIVGSGISGVGGTVFLYRSADLVSWQYLNPILIGDQNKDGAIWECPNLFQLDDKWVLIVSTHNGHDVEHVKYFVGNFAGGHFTPESEGYVDHAYLYAALTFLDNSGRRLMWGWLREGRSVDAAIQAGWSGSQSIPRQLSLDDHNRLLMEPIVEIERIRGKAHHLANINLSDEALLNIRSLTFDMVGQFYLSTTGTLSIVLASSSSADEATEIVYDRKISQLIVKRIYPNATSDLESYPHVIQHQLDPNEILTLRIILDGSTLEIIANKRTSVSTRIYPSSSDNNFVRVTGKDSKLIAMGVYEMPSIW